ncbi:hypothetical protein KBD71_00665 [Candidatus Woesebacteria bacterium]|nr:hypothetical protein [Candidatus Woesebacteria bacterium]
MTTKFIERFLPEFQHRPLIERLRQTAIKQPSVGFATDEQFQAALVAAIAERSLNQDEGLNRSTAQRFINNLLNSKQVLSGYDDFARYAAATTDEELRFNAAIHPEIIDRALVLLLQSQRD